jgi:hypothetical protein
MAVGPDSRQRSGRLAHKSVLPIAVGIVKLARILQRLKAIRSGRDGGPARGQRAVLANRGKWPRFAGTPKPIELVSLDRDLLGRNACPPQ